MKKGRTYMTVKNVKYSMVFFLLQILIGFYSRKIFLDFLGSEVLGMNTTLSNILGFINLAEMGIGVAMATALYEPLYRKDYTMISEIMSVQGYLYRRIAYLFLLISIPLCCAFPFIFQQITFPLYYIYATYLICLWGIIANYCWNYREILINADQKNYRLIPYINGGRIIKTILQILTIKYAESGYWGWLLIELIHNIVITFVINYVVRKEFPWLAIDLSRSKELLVKYSSLLRMSKQLFFHKFSGYILTESSPLIIYAYVSLSMVTYYGNYMMVIGYSASFINSMFVGIGASIGNLVAENNKSHIMRVFWELFTSRLWVATVTAFSLFVFIPSFIELWLGKEYLLDKYSLGLILFYMFVKVSRTVVESFKDAYKLFDDIWAPIVEACLNLSLSVLLGYIYGLNGILLGVNISLFLVVLLWKPYYVFKYGFKKPVASFIKNYVLQVLVLSAACFLVYSIMKYWHYDYTRSYVNLAIYTFIYSVFYALVSFGLLCLFTSSMRMFARRLLVLIGLKS